MSKRISEIQSEFNIESATIKSAINSGGVDTLHGVSFSSVTPITHNFSVYNSGYKTDEVSVTKYVYNGVEHNTEQAAQSARNADIDSKIGVVNGKISKCNSYKNKLENINRDCEESIKNLEQDKTEVSNQISKLGELEGLVSRAKGQYIQAKSSMQSCFKCSSYGLNIATGNAINYIQNEECSSQNNGLDDVVSKLGEYINDGENIKNSINSLKSELDGKISKLNEQITWLNSQKR